MKDIIIRDFREDDYDQVIRLWTETHLTYPERDDSKENIRNCLSIGGKFLVMEDTSQDLITGTSWMTFDGRRMYLHHFGILPAYQGKGYGTSLAKASLRFIHSEGYQVKLEVHKNNKIAGHLYSKLGFFSFTDYDIYMIRDIRNIPPEKLID